MVGGGGAKWNLPGPSWRVDSARYSEWWIQIQGTKVEEEAKEVAGDSGTLAESVGTEAERDADIVKLGFTVCSLFSVF